MQFGTDRDARLPAPGRLGFEFTAHMREVCRDAVARTPELRHVRLDHKD